MKADKKPLNAPVHPGIHRNLKLRAAEEGLTMTALLEDAIAHYLNFRWGTPDPRQAGTQKGRRKIPKS